MIQSWIGRTDWGSRLRIAIVGGGVAGCYCAYRLSHAFPDSTIHLLEMSERIGGRLWSVPIDGVAGSPAEIGGMFFGDMQENVFGLINELKLPSELVNWSRRHQYLRGEYLDDARYEDASENTIPFRLGKSEIGKGPAQLLLYALAAIAPDFMDLWPMNLDAPRSPQATIKYLRELVHTGRNLCDWGFWNLLAEVLSNEAYNLLLATLGSTSIFRNANAYDAIWMFMLEIAPSQNFFRIIGGYQSLPETLLSRASDACRVHKQHRLTHLERKKSGFRLRIEGPKSRSTLAADKIILAMPRRALELVDIDKRIVDPDEWRDLLDAVAPVPACKLFLKFDNPWWDLSVVGPSNLQALDVSVAFTDLPMRQCYYYGSPKPADPVLLMATYADDIATSFWSGLRHPQYCEVRPSQIAGRASLCSSLAMETAALSQLSAMHHDCKVPDPTDGLFFDWSEDPYGAGWHAWEPYRKSWEIMPQVRQPNSALNFFVCGEAFAQHQGWVEGAINSAEKVLETLGLSRPAWVRADYPFEL